MRLIVAALAVLSCQSLSAQETQEPAFVAGKDAGDVWTVGVMTVTKGAVAGKQAHRIDAGGGDVSYAVTLQRVTSWNDADRACKEFAPKGRWALLTRSDLSLAIIAQAFVGLPMEHVAKHVYWPRGADDGTRTYEGTDTVALETEGWAEGNMTFKLAESVASIKAALRRGLLRNPERDHTVALLAELENGVSVRCMLKPR